MTASFQTEGLVAPLTSEPAWHLSRHADGRLILHRQNAAGTEESLCTETEHSLY